MLKSAIIIELSQPERKQLEQIAHSRKEEYRMVQRAIIILNAADGVKNHENARILGISVKTVRKWRKCYYQRRLREPESTVKQRISDAYRKGSPAKFDAFFFGRFNSPCNL